MKKFIFLLATLAYFASTSGATIYFHECMGKVIDVNFKPNERNECFNCGMHKNAAGDCCNDHVKVLKIQNDNQLPVSFLKNLQAPLIALPATFFISPDESIGGKNRSTPLSYTPPRSNELSYCILYCTFLI